VVGLVNVILKHHPTIEDIISNILLLERDIQNPKKTKDIYQPLFKFHPLSSDFDP
jgi:hypothetical protein